MAPECVQSGPIHARRRGWRAQPGPQKKMTKVGDAMEFDFGEAKGGEARRGSSLSVPFPGRFRRRMFLSSALMFLSTPAPVECPRFCSIRPRPAPLFWCVHATHLARPLQDDPTEPCGCKAVTITAVHDDDGTVDFTLDDGGRQFDSIELGRLRVPSTAPPASYTLHCNELEPKKWPHVEPVLCRIRSAVGAMNSRRVDARRASAPRMERSQRLQRMAVEWWPTTEASHWAGCWLLWTVRRAVGDAARRQAGALHRIRVKPNHG